MRSFIVQTRITPAVSSVGTRPSYPLVVGGVAFALSLSMLIPFVPVLVGTVLARRERWIAIVMASSFGSATGATILFLVFHHLGWYQVIDAYPDLSGTAAWVDMTRWVTAYGTWALFLLPRRRSRKRQRSCWRQLPIYLFNKSLLRCYLENVPNMHFTLGPRQSALLGFTMQRRHTVNEHLFDARHIGDLCSATPPRPPYPQSTSRTSLPYPRVGGRQLATR